MAKGIKVFLLVFCILCVQSQLCAAPQDLERCDKLFDESKFSESIAVLEEMLKTNPDDYQILWRLSRDYSKEGSLKKKKKEKKEYFNKAVDFARRAISVNDAAFEGHLYLAETLGKLSRILKAEEKVHLSSEIKSEAERTIELNPRHFQGYMILGMWHRKVKNANWIEKQVARAFFGGLPEASLDEAERNLKKSIELKSDLPESHYELALVYKMSKRKKMAVEELKKAADCPGINKRQEEVREKAVKLLKKLK